MSDSYLGDVSRCDRCGVVTPPMFLRTVKPAPHHSWLMICRYCIEFPPELHRFDDTSYRQARRACAQNARSMGYSRHDPERSVLRIMREHDVDRATAIRVFVQMSAIETRRGR